MKKLWIISVCILLLCCCTLSVSASSAETASFEGEREVVYVMDSSMLSNYLEGGRAALDLYIRANKPEWLVVQYESEQRTLYLKMSFSFESEEDYAEKLSQLTQFVPAAFYSPGPPESFTENVSAEQLLNFCRESIENGMLENIYTLDEIINFHSGTMRINENTYTVGRRININVEPLDVAAEYISISTVIGDTHRYDRVIQIHIPADQLDAGKEENSECG